MNNLKFPSFIILSLYQNHIMSGSKEYFLDDIINKNYDIIIFSVQDSNIKSPSYDSLLKLVLKKNNYDQISKIEPAEDKIGSKIRIYRKQQSNLIITSNNLNYTILKFNKNNKMAICLNMIFLFNNKKYKFSIINLNLYYNFYNKNSDSIKKEQFIQIISKFQLISKLKNNYNIFLLGNFNFKLIKFIEDFNSIKYNQISKKIIKNSKNINFSKKYLSINNTNKIEVGNQLIKYLKNIQKDFEKNNVNSSKFKLKFIKKLINSIKFFGLKISCHYYEKKSNKIKFYSLKKEPLIPSACDRILFALPKSKKNKNIIENDQIIINKNNFNIKIDSPDFSSHRLIYLSFDLK